MGFARRVGAYSAAIRQFAQYFEDTEGAAGLADRIARMLDRAGEATPAALDAQFYERTMAVPNVSGKYIPGIVAAQERAISDLAAVGWGNGVG